MKYIFEIQIFLPALVYSSKVQRYNINLFCLFLICKAKWVKKEHGNDSDLYKGSDCGK